MKVALATVALFGFLFAFSAKTTPVGAATPEPVLDIAGEKLKAGASYYVLPSRTGKGGGLTFGTVGNDECPRVVVQEKSEISKGVPVQFLPNNTKNHVVFTSRNLNIKFSRSPNPTSCEESRVWKLTKYISEAMHVGTNGVERFQGPSLSNWFMIEKTEDKGVYKLKFCPAPTYLTCEDLSVFFMDDDNTRYIGLANPGHFQTFSVMFQKADEVVMSS